MTIPEAAVEAALDVVMNDGHNGLDCRPDRNLGVTVRAALEAALPYLAPAGAVKVSDGTVEALARALAKQADVHGMPWHVRKAVLRDVVPYLEFDLDAAPTADERPLRAALEKYFSNGGPDTPIRTTWHDGVEHWEAPAEDIRELIEGSAVPQPVDREALAKARDEGYKRGEYDHCDYPEGDCPTATLNPYRLAGEQEQVER